MSSEVKIHPEPVAVGLQSDHDRIMACDDPSMLISELTAVLAQTVEGVIKTAWIVKRLDQLDIEVDLPGIRPALRFIRHIASGKLVPEAYVACLANPKLLKICLTLTESEQRKVAENRPFKVLTVEGDTHYLVPALELSDRQLKQVFDGTGVRNAEEQSKFIRNEVEKEKIKAAGKGNHEEVVVDRRRKRIIVRGKAMTISDLSRYVYELSGK